MVMKNKLLHNNNNNNALHLLAIQYIQFKHIVIVKGRNADFAIKADERKGGRKEGGKTGGEDAIITITLIASSCYPPQNIRYNFCDLRLNLFFFFDTN
jgi:hypothetical protein